MRGRGNSGGVGRCWQFLIGAAFGGLIACVILITSSSHVSLTNSHVTQQTTQQHDDGHIQEDISHLSVETKKDRPPYVNTARVNDLASLQPMQRQLFSDRPFSLPTNGKSKIPQIKGTDHSTIFIAISSYRDVECAETLLEMYSQALNPDRFRVRIVQHVSNVDVEEDESCSRFYTLAKCGEESGHPICRNAKHIVIKTFPRTQGMGPVDGRHRVQALLDDEEFALMMDAHTKFQPHWDRQMMDNWNDLGDEMAIITTYPGGFIARSDPVPKTHMMTILCDSRFMEELRIPRHQAGHYAPPGKNYLVPFWSACVSFSKAHAFRTVMFDCCAPYTFDGEEFSYGIRLWTHGYDFYSPKDNILLHQYYHPGVVERTGRKRNLYHENKWNEHYRVMRKSNERFRQMLGLEPTQDADLTDIDKYGMGNVRTREQFMAFSGVDLNKETQEFVCDKIIHGEGLKLVPLSYDPILPYVGTTIDPDPALEQIREHEKSS